MQDVVASLLGAGLVYGGFFLRYFMDRTASAKQQNKEPTFTHMAISEGLLCGYVETVLTEPDDPWGFLLEPCENNALVIMGGNALCEDHRDSYLLEMSQHK